jgi:hypothetical protein
VSSKSRRDPTGLADVGGRYVVTLSFVMAAVYHSMPPSLQALEVSAFFDTSRLDIPPPCRSPLALAPKMRMPPSLAVPDVGIFDTCSLRARERRRRETRRALCRLICSPADKPTDEMFTTGNQRAFSLLLACVRRLPDRIVLRTITTSVSLM